MMSVLSATCILTLVFTYKQTIMVTNGMHDPFSNPPFAIRSVLLLPSAFCSSCSVLMSWFKWSIDQFRRGEWRESAIVRQRKSRVIGLHHTPKSRAKGWAGFLGLKENDSHSSLIVLVHNLAGIRVFAMPTDGWEDEALLEVLVTRPQSMGKARGDCLI